MDYLQWGTAKHTLKRERHIKFIVLLIFLLFGISPLFGQKEILNFHQLTTEMGLSESTNSFLHMDEERTAWISSLDGLNRFDGKKVEVFRPNSESGKGIKGGDIQSPFFENGKGDIWFTTAEAVNWYRKDKGIFVSIYPKGQKFQKSLMPYAFFLEKNRFLWVRSEFSLYRIDTFNPILAEREPVVDNFTCIRATLEEDTDGSIKRIYAAYWNWAERKGFEVIELAQDYPYKVIRRDTLFARKGYPADFTVNVSQIISNIGTETCFITNKGLLFFDPKNPNDYLNKLYTYPAKLLQKNNYFPHATRNGNKLFLSGGTEKLFSFNLLVSNRGFITKGISAFNLDQKSFISSINKVFIGKDSTLWLEGEGMFYANIKNKGMYSLFHRNLLPPTSVRHIFLHENGDVLGITRKGVGWIFSQDGQIQKQEVKKYPSSFKQIQLKNSDIWAISSLGLTKVESDLTSFNWDKKSLDQGIIFDLVAYKNQYLILGTQGRLLVYDTYSQRYFQLPNLEFCVKLFIDHKNQLWTFDGSNSLNVFKVSDSPLRIKLLKRFTNSGIVNQFSSDTLLQSIFIASSKGLFRIHDDLKDDTLLDKSNKLFDQYTQSVVIDGRHNIWLGTNSGIVFYRTGSRVPNIKKLSTRDGLSTNEYTSGEALLALDGNIWFASSKGIDIIPPEMKNIGKPPKICLKSVKIHGKSPKLDTIINLKRSLILESTENTLTFELEAPEYTDPKRNKFKVYLEHNNRIDSTIIEEGSSITYPYLPHGNYHFRFTACNAEGIWQPIHKSLNIKINPPFYLKVWFLSLVSVISLTIIISIPTFIYRYRLKGKQLALEKQQRLTDKKELELQNQQALQQERDQINAEFHSILNEGLITIKNTCSIAIETLGSEETSEPFNLIYEKTNELFEKKKYLIWAIDPDSSSLEDLIILIRHYSVTLLDSNKLSTQIKIPTDISDFTVSSKVKYSLFMTIKELLHNILKYSKATNVYINILDDDGELIFYLRDDGQGFDFAEKIKDKNKSYGLHKCIEWIEGIQGTIVWKNFNKSGMLTTIRIPLLNVDTSPTSDKQ